MCKTHLTVQKGHIKCTVVQQKAHWPPIFNSVFELSFMCRYKKYTVLDNKSLIRLITGSGQYPWPQFSNMKKERKLDTNTERLRHIKR